MGYCFSKTIEKPVCNAIGETEAVDPVSSISAIENPGLREVSTGVRTLLADIVCQV